MIRFLSFAFICLVLAGCGTVETPRGDSLPDGLFYASYRDIPGVTDAEIQAIEAMRGQTASFVYGMTRGTESFLDMDGDISGFTTQFCELLTSLFDIPFQPALYTRNDLVAGLESGSIDFSGDLTATEDCPDICFAAGPIAFRTVNIFRLEGSRRSLNRIARRRALRYAFLTGSTIKDEVIAVTKDSIEIFWADNYETAYQMIKDGTVDAFLSGSTATSAFDAYGDITSGHFYPLIFSEVSLTTRKPSSEPIISVVQKMLDNDGIRHLGKMYAVGEQVGKRDKLFRMLTENEREYLRNRKNAEIPIAAEYYNYPVSFYNSREKEWQGIFMDVLNEVENLTGLSFKIINDYDTPWRDLLEMLESGKASIVSELIRTPEREGRFLWPSTVITENYYGIASKANFRYVDFNEILHMRVGYIRSLAVCVLALILILILIKRNEKRLEREVQSHTVELKEAMQIAESANLAKSSFLATMSHEIRTPMNAIMGIAQIQLQEEGLPSKTEDAFNRIYSSSHSLLRIINDILDQSKIEAGKLELIPAEYSIPSLINDAIQLNIIRIGEKPVVFVAEADENLPSELIGDELRIKQILNNLLSNAIKYTDSGAVNFSISHETLSDGATLLRFSIKDSGQGMTPEDKANLFTEYQRFNTDSNRATEGTGLGLSITKRLVAMMNGKIEVDSVYGEGSTFTVEVVQESMPCVPIGREVAAALKNYTYTYAHSKEKRHCVRHIMPYGKVLVVDDVDTNLYVASGLLNPYKLDVKTALSGFEAIELVEAGNTYDIIFMDHMMPKMDGIETTQKLRESGYDGIIVALTANALTGNEKMFSDYGFDGFVSKPIDIRRLDIVLNKFIRDRHPEEAQKYESYAEELTLSSTVPIGPKLLDVFCREAKAAVATLRETLLTGDIKLFTITAHAMKAALANIGKDKLSEEAFALETAGKTGDTKFISANSENFIKSLETLADSLKPADEAGDGTNPLAGDADISEDTAYLAEMLNVVKTACENYQIQAAYQALDELKKKSWKKETTDTLNSIRDKLFLESDFDGAAELAGKL